MRVLVIGYTGSGKSTLIRSIARYLGTSVTINISHGSQAGTLNATSYTIHHDEFWDSPGFCDAAGRDDTFNREMQQLREFRDFDVAVYCYRPTRRVNQSGIRYSQLFGSNTPVTLCINNYVDADERADLQRQAVAEVQAEGLVVREVFFIPPSGVIDATQDVHNLYNRLQQFNNNNHKIQFTPGPISSTAVGIVRNKRCVEAAQRAAAAVEVVVFCSQGMGNGQERKELISVPAGRAIISTRIEEYSVNDGNNNGFSRMRVINPSTVEVHARMPCKRGGFIGIGEEGQWRDARYHVTHTGSVDAGLLQEQRMLTQQHPQLVAEIMSNWDYYNQRA